MILLEVPENRDHRHDYWLGGTTAAVAGFVNVCSVIAFFAFASNVTGHVAIFAEELVKGHWHQFTVVIVWLLAFILGAFVANLVVTAIGLRAPRLARAVPLVLEILLLIGIGYYGHNHYTETLTETEYLVGLLLFTMGLQNSMVATVSKGIVKTTHLTGLSTDLGMEISMFLQPRYRKDDRLRFKLKLHLLIFLMYVTGGVIGGAMFLNVGFRAFHLAAMVLGFIFIHDLVMTRINADARHVMFPRAAKIPRLRS
jgi:uncharacterized membrane protein YoaK (UPF0700 family)